MKSIIRIKSYINYLNVNRKIIISVCLLLFTFSLFAQVTIGIDETAEKAALLQIKNVKVQKPSSVTDLSNASVDKDGGGLALPRVHLKNKNTLEPFIEPLSMDWIEAALNKIKEKHAGLMVYNLTTTGDFKQGIYVWDGTQWDIAGNGGTSTPTEDAWLRSGNTGTIAGTHFVGTTDLQGLAFKTNNAERMRISDEGEVGIGTANPLASLHVQGDMILTDAPKHSGANVMVIDNSGSVGIAAPEAPINKLLYVQSKSNQRIEGGTLTSLNNGSDIVVTWSDLDESNYGNLLTRNTDHSFTFNEKALCEVSGYVNYQPNAKAPLTYLPNYNDYVAAVNVIIQYATAAAPNNWTTLTGARHLYPGATAEGPIQSVHIPAAIMVFNKNDKIRMVVKRPSPSFGLPHGSGTATFAAIGVPTGSTFSKSMKITTM